ncbi:hypothetical protein BDW60DRAFT_19758 [Aspergillus nidulans var. acristatus]
MRPILRLHVIWRNFPVVENKSALSPCRAAATSDRSQFDPAKPPILHMLPRKPRPNHSILSLESMLRYALVPGFIPFSFASWHIQTCEVTCISDSPDNAILYSGLRASVYRHQNIVIDLVCSSVVQSSLTLGGKKKKERKKERATSVARFMPVPEFDIITFKEDQRRFEGVHTNKVSKGPKPFDQSSPIVHDTPQPTEL